MALKLSMWPQAAREMCLLDVKHKSFLLVERRSQLMCLALSRSPFFSQESTLFLLLLPSALSVLSLHLGLPAHPPTLLTQVLRKSGIMAVELIIIIFLAAAAEHDRWVDCAHVRPPGSAEPGATAPAFMGC